MSLLPALAIALPLGMAAVAALGWRSVLLQRLAALTGASGLAVVGWLLVGDVLANGPRAVAVGAWGSPLGIALVADGVGALMVLVAGVLGLVALAFACLDLPAERWLRGYAPFALVLLAGACGAFMAADLFNLFVWFEVGLLATAGLLALSADERAGGLDGLVYYQLPNLLGSTLFLAGAGLVYGLTGTLELALIGPRLAEVAASQPGALIGVIALLATSFGLKSAIWPLSSWLPTTYPAADASSAALLAGLSTKVGVVALIRLAGILPLAWMTPWLDALLALAAATLLLGLGGAIAQREIDRILAFHSISQIGYIAIGVAIFAAAEAPAVRRAGLAAALVFMVHHSLVKPALFLVGGAVRARRGSSELAGGGGLVDRAPGLATLFALAAIGLVGVPPLSGFWSKLGMLQSALDAGQLAVALIALFAGVLTLLSMVKIWEGVFWGEPDPQAAAPATPPWAQARSLALAPLVAISLAIGLAPDALLELAQLAAEQLEAAR